MTDLGVVRRGKSPLVELAVDAELRVTDWGPRAELSFGVARAAAIGREIAALIPIAGDATWRSVLVEDDAACIWRLA